MNRISLNAGWQFIKLPRGIPVERENLDWETVSLPHTWYREEDPYHGLVLYRREIGVGKAWKKAFLEFEGADRAAVFSSTARRSASTMAPMPVSASRCPKRR